MNDQTYVGQRVQTLEAGPQFDVYTRVIIHKGQTTDAQGNTIDNDIISGNTTGRTMEITDPLGTKEKADALLAKLQGNSWRYRPHRAENALLDPAAELGDALTINDIYSEVCSTETNFSSLMEANLEAPSDEEIEHEYPYMPKADREYRRETAFLRSQISLTNGIALKVQSDFEEYKRTSSAEIDIGSDSIQAIVQSTYAQNLISYPYVTPTNTTLNNAKFTSNNKGECAVEGTANAARTLFELGKVDLQNNRTYTISINGGTSQTNKECHLYVSYDKSTPTEDEPKKTTATWIAHTNSYTSFTVKGSDDAWANYTVTVYIYVPVGKVTKKEFLYPQLEFGGQVHPWQKTAGSYTSRITQNEDEISARVTKTGGSRQSFGWNLSATSWKIYSGNTEVLSVDATNGLKVKGNGEFSGKITATSGYIGTAASGFEIGSNYIRNGMKTLSDTNPGICISTNGIAIGGGAFKATSSGNVTANNLTLSGTLNMKNKDGTGGVSITPSNLASYALDANNWLNTKSVPYNGNLVTPASYCSGGAGAGYSAQGTWDVATDATGNGVYYFRAVNIYATKYLAAASLAVPWGSFTYGGNVISSAMVTDVNGNNVAVLSF